jgi:hypothetical protein
MFSSYTPSLADQIHLQAGLLEDLAYRRVVHPQQLHLLEREPRHRPGRRPHQSPNPDADGVTTNDRKDRDTGPNTLQNFPRLASATTADPGITTIKGALNSRPRKTYLIQFFSSATKNSAGFAEGKTFVGQVTKKTNREGKRSFSLRTVLPTGENIVTATATSLDTSTMLATPTDTSEFSRAVTAS